MKNDIEMNNNRMQQASSSNNIYTKYASKAQPDLNATGYERFMTTAGNFFGWFGQIPCCLLCPNPYKQVPQGQVGLISRFGRFIQTVDPGLNWVNPLTESMVLVDIKKQVISINDVRITTKDNVNITIDPVIYYHISDPFLATYGVSRAVTALAERAQTTVRTVLGQKTLQEIIEQREGISVAIEEALRGPAQDWGLEVQSHLIKDIQFSRELQESLSSAAQAKRIAESKIIHAQAEVDAAKLMREAADILNSEAAIQIRYLDTMQSMSKSTGAKVIFFPYNAHSSAGNVHQDMKNVIMNNQMSEF